MKFKQDCGSQQQEQSCEPAAFIFPLYSLCYLIAFIIQFTSYLHSISLTSPSALPPLTVFT